MGKTHTVELPNGDEFTVDYSNDLLVDRDTLDISWEKHPMMCFAYSVALAEARQKVNNLKREHKIMLAETILDVKQNPRDYDLPLKPTVDQVKSAAECDVQCEGLWISLVDAEHESDLLAAAVKSLDSKKSAMESLVKLHGQSYFSNPQTDMEGGQTLKDTKRKRVAHGTNKKKRKVIED